MRNRITKINVLIVGILAFGIVCLTMPSTASAQEINPTPGTYSYGSTSEFSPYVSLASSSTLAPTGADQNIGYFAALALVVVSSGIVLFIVRKRHKNVSAKS